MPEKAIINAVVKAARALPGYPALSVLDISCGDAVILEQLLAEGCRVEGTHYCDNDYIRKKDRVIPEEITIHPGVDLSRPLPFDNQRYDVVIMTEVIEHLDAHTGILHEAGRILRPGGHLILSTPNLHRLSSRARFFFTGCHHINQRRVGWDIPRDRLYAYHIHTPDLPLLHALLYQAGFARMRPVVTRIEPAQVGWMLLYPLFALATRLRVRPRRKYPEDRNRGERDLYRLMMHPATLMSKQLMLVARKQG